MSFLTVLRLAFVMIAGPQIIAAILLATDPDARRNSLALVTGAAWPSPPGPWPPTG